MATTSKTKKITISDSISQGDVFRDVKFSFISNESDSSVEVVEYVFPYAIVISQACDTQYVSDFFESSEGKPTKFMPSILMCPIYNEVMVKTGDHLIEVLKVEDIKVVKDMIFTSDEKKTIENDWHYRFHKLIVERGKIKVIENSIIDFKHYFSVPVKQLLKNRKDRILRLDDIYSEQITLKFSVYLSRAAIPSNIPDQ